MAGEPAVRLLPRSRRARAIAAVLSVLALAAAAALERMRSAHTPAAVQRRAAALEHEADVLLFERGKPAAALEIYRRACALQPRFTLWHKQAIAALELGRTEQALEAIERALDHAPPELDGERYRTGLAALRAGQLETARAALESAYHASRPEASEPLR